MRSLRVLPGQHCDAETGNRYNYFRDYDPRIGRFAQSDALGLEAGLNTFAYGGSNPVALLDRWGLSAADVEGVYRDVRGSFQDLRPDSPGIDYRPQKHPGEGYTGNWDGQIYIDPSWRSKECFSKNEYLDLFFLIFHEGMHSTDTKLQRMFTTKRHHDSIYNREALERGSFRDPPKPIWGTPGPGRPDLDDLYEKYRKRTPACCPAK